ncbi:hypothetical protein CH252_04890 [Rhodococcus sp. 06-1477-1B]|nr:hypothetical protein CH252_04890 [Rhodococcus sp. 06-1477-1B]
MTVWQAQKVVTEVVYIDHPDGSRTQTKKKVRLRGTAPTKQLAQQRLDALYKRYLVQTGELPVTALGLAPTAETVTVGDWLETWYKRRANSGEVAGSSLNRYRGLLDNHIIPAIGDIPLRLFTLSDVNKLMFETLPAKQKTKLNPKTGEREPTGERLLNNSPMRKIQDVLTQSMRMALEEKKITVDPMVGFKRIPKQGMTESKRRILAGLSSLPQEMVEGLYGKPELGYWVLALMGLRQAERLGVEFSSFKNLFDRGKPVELYLNRQLEHNDLTKQFNIKYVMKTFSGERIIIVPEPFREALLLWVKQREEWSSSPSWKPLKGLENLVFLTKTGKPIRHQNDGVRFKKVQKELGREPNAWGHALRHLVATTLGEQGVHPEVAKTILGHASAAIHAYYISFNKQATAEPLAKVSEVFHGDAVVADEFFTKLAGGEFKKTDEEEQVWESEYQDNPEYQKFFVGDADVDEEDYVEPSGADSEFNVSDAEMYRAVKSGQARI